MAPELRELLNESAGRPQGPTDLDDIARRARRIRRGRRARVAVSTLAVLALAVPAVRVVRDLLPGPGIGIAQQPTPVDGATAASVAAPTFAEPGTPTTEPAPTAASRAGVSPDGLRWVLDIDGLRDLDGGSLRLPDDVTPDGAGDLVFLDRDTAWLLVGGGGGAAFTTYRTTDGGATWEANVSTLAADAATESWASARILPVTADVVYLWIGEGAAGVADRGSALAISRDGGRTWEDAGRAPGSRFVAPSAPDILWSAKAGGSENDTLWVSRDGGGTWTEAPLEAVGDDVRVVLLGIAFHEANADLQAIHVYSDERQEAATYLFGSPTWTLAGAVPFPMSWAIEGCCVDPEGYTSVSVASEWWLLDTGLQVFGVTRSFLGSAWTVSFRPLGSYYDGTDQRVAAYERGPCSTACDRTYTSPDGVRWITDAE